MKNLQKIGAFSAFYLAAAYLVNIVLYIFVLDYVNIVDPLQKVALLADQKMMVYLTNLSGYVIFGILLAVLMLALYERLNSGSPAITRVAVVIGILWAGMLIASGSVANAGIAPTVALYQSDPAQAVLTWTAIESVSNGLGGANGEILGGLMTLLISWAGFRSARLHKGLNSLGLVVGTVGLLSAIPGLNNLAQIFGISQIFWFVWLGITLFRQPAPKAAPAVTELASLSQVN